MRLVGFNQPEYVSYVLSGGFRDIPQEALRNLLKLPRQRERLVCVVFRNLYDVHHSLGCNFKLLEFFLQCVLGLWQFLQFFKASSISLSESALIFLSLAISSAFRYIRIFRSSTRLSSIFNDFVRAVYSTKGKNLINTRGIKLLDFFIKGRH